MDDLDLRRLIYRRLAHTGEVPSFDEIADLVGGPVEAASSLGRLHDRHMIVLDDRDDPGEIAMALPFASRPTGHRVVGSAGSWWANCAWDALAIPAALDADARIEATWLDTDEPVDLSIEGGELSTTDGWVHFAVPARRWWDDIVET
ncbi:MAG: organomercurial lyase [Actinomycetota bacterium]